MREEVPLGREVGFEGGQSGAAWTSQSTTQPPRTYIVHCPRDSVGALEMGNALLHSVGLIPY